MLHGFPTFHRLGERLELIVDEARRLDADVVLLQEVPWTPAMGGVAEALAARLAMNHVYLRANGNRGAILFEEGEAILS
jgi:endonuclease/exonuclease/phosphatase family metal-dependent hydrolase